MIIGVPRERKSGEKRVAITPEGAKQLTAQGHQVLIETNAGALSRFTDEQYSAVGGTICKELSEVWNNCNLLVKVKEPAPEELTYFRPDLAVFSFLHLAVAPEVTNALLKHNVIGLDYDLVNSPDGRLPILEPMSVIAGKLAAQCGAVALQASSTGSTEEKGILIGGTPGVNPAKVVVIGAGVAGSNAATVASGMGADVVIMDINQKKLDSFSGTKIRTAISSQETITKEISNADIVVGAVLIPGALAPKLLTRSMLKDMQPGTVLVDICIDQGGFAETSKATTIAEPTFVVDGIIHYCVANMPAMVPRTSTKALTAVTLPYIQELANKGINKALLENKSLFHSLTTYQGKLTNKRIGEALNIPATSEEETLKSLG
jgi:alanine dehydrogenase